MKFSFLIRFFFTFFIIAPVFSCRCSLIITNDLEDDIIVGGDLVVPDRSTIIYGNWFSIQSNDMGPQTFVRENSQFQQQNVFDLIVMRNNSVLFDQNGIPIIKRVA